jgi:hypothetical protein
MVSVTFILWKILKEEEAHLEAELLACSPSKSKLKTNKRTLQTQQYQTFCAIYPSYENNHWN